MRVTMETQFRTLAMVQWVVSFVAMGLLCQLLLLYTLLWTRLWPLALLYYTWWLTDINTPHRGGRRCNWVRRWTVWSYLRDYFPVKLVKTAELPPERSFVLALHPHGVLSVGAFVNFATEATGFSRIFPGITPHLATLPLNFRMPLYRDYIMAGGVCPASREALSNRLRLGGGAGDLVVLVVGGASEALLAQPGKHTVLLGVRRGFLRLALTHGAWLVPAFSFGEAAVLTSVPLKGVWHRLQAWAVRALGVAPLIFSGRGLLTEHGVLPYARPISTVVGSPIPVERVIHPSHDEVERLHRRYTDALLHLFETNKEKYGLAPTDHLVIT